MPPIFTIGHSTHSLEHFLGLLKQREIGAVCDVRSMPYSRMNPQFNRETLKDSLRGARIVDGFLGRELGARSQDPGVYADGKVQYDLLAKTDLFRRGIARVMEGIRTYRIALMCAEKDPMDCHRTILVSRHLDEMGIAVVHILADGSLEPHSEVVTRLRDKLGLPESDLFRSPDAVTEDVYLIQGGRIAYEAEEPAVG